MHKKLAPSDRTTHMNLLPVQVFPSILIISLFFLCWLNKDVVNKFCIFWLGRRNCWQHTHARPILWSDSRPLLSHQPVSPTKRIKANCTNMTNAFLHFAQNKTKLRIFSMKISRIFQKLVEKKGEKKEKYI